jgi:ADP-ribosylglycohydrolase
METAASAVIYVLLSALHGAPLTDAIRKVLDAPIDDWLHLPDEHVVGNVVSPACYVEDAVPATLYLALKYKDDPEAGLVANTNLGGDNVHRGAVLGAILGAANGAASLPERWREGLLRPV